MGYVELAKKSKPNNSFLKMTCSNTQLKEPHRSFLKMTCSDVSDKGEIVPAPYIDKSVAEDVVHEFRLYATEFDMLYYGVFMTRRV